ncbi:MAG: hypothetical protein JNM63_09785, partial [Spirochaetia bacterium]|nr:hypothetical protein [Spirochaetia bacterium]
HYRVKIAVKGAVAYQMEDMFGVFVPNGKRVNRQPMYFGSQDQGMWKGEEENILHKDWMRSLGVDLERAGITGGRFEFERGNVKSSDGFTFELKELAKHDIDVFICYLNVPEYNTKGSGTPPLDQALFQEHAEHIGTYLSQFPNVKYVEFWNEPDVEAFNGTTEDYLSALKSFYTGIKKTAPHIKVTTGGMTVKHPREKKDFTRDVYIKGKGFYDIAAFHAHGPVENYMELNETVEGYLQQAGNPVPICNTEAGDRSAYDYGGYRSQAATLIKKITYAKTRSATEFYAWFTLKDYWDMDPNADDSFGLINTDNRVKPSFLAYNELIRELANTRTGAVANLDERLVSYQFARENGDTVYVLWPKTAGANVAFALSTKTPVTRTDMFGKNETLQPEGGKVFVSVAGYPIYLTTSKGGALAAAKGDSSFFDCPSSVGAAPGEKIAFQAGVKNVWQKEANVELKLFNDKSVEIGNYSFALAKGAVKNIPLSIEVPARETFGAKNYYFTFNAPENGIQNMFVPLSVVASYQAVQVPGAFSQDPGAALAKAKARTIVLDKPDDVRELAFDALIPKWSGPNDLSVKASVGHDGKNVCFTFDVSDDKHLQSFDNGDIWKGDSVQVGFYSADGKESEFALALGPNGPVTWCHLSSDKKNIGKWEVPAQVKREGGHTLYEVVVPFEKIGVSLAKDKSLFRFAFLVNDDDGRGRVRFAQWFNGIGGMKNPDLYGYGQFEIK